MTTGRSAATVISNRSVAVVIACASSGEQLPPLADQEPLAERERRSLRDEIDRLRAELRDAHRDDISADTIRSACFGLAAANVAPPQWLIDAPAATSGPGVPITVWSDWHWGEVVSREQLGGLNEFNSEIARARARRLVERIIDLTHSHMVAPIYPGIVVALIGDFFSGEIHEELTETNDQTLPAALLDLCGVLVWALETLAARFPEVVVPCVTGNHDRISKRPRFKDAAINSYTWILYNVVEARLKDRGVSNVRFMISPTFECYLSVYGHRYGFTHGDRLGVKGGDGIIGMLGPVKRGTLRMSEQQRIVGRDVDTWVMGHGHSYQILRGVVVNGSLKGYDEYAHGNRFAPEPPAQALWFHHPRRGITCHWPIQLEDTPGNEAAAWCEAS